jgi:hypothetical protein
LGLIKRKKKKEKETGGKKKKIRREHKIREDVGRKVGKAGRQKRRKTTKLLIR